MKKAHFNYKPVIVLVISLIVLMTTVFGLRQWQRNRLAYTALQTGLKAYDNHLWQEAAANLGRYLAVNQGDLQILLKYAEAQLKIRPLKRDNIQQACSIYRSILRINGNNSIAAEKIISLYLQMDIPAEAELIARRFLQTNENPRISTMLAMALAKQRNVKEAAEQLQSVIEKHPEQIQAYEVIAQFVQYQGEDLPVTAEHWFNEAVKNNPFSARALISRAGFYLRKRDIATALTDLENAEKLDLSDVSVRLRLAGEFAKINMPEKARTHLAGVQAQDAGNLELWQRWAIVSLKTMSKEEMSMVALTGLKELGADSWDFMPTAAELFIRCGQLDRAGDCITRLRQKDINPVAVALLGGLLAEAEKQDHKAILFWRRAQQLGDKSEKTRLALTRVYCRAGDSQSAILQLRTLVSEQPALFSGHYNLARLLAQDGNWAEAAEQARLALQISADNIDAVLLRIRAQIQSAKSMQPDINEQIWQDIEMRLAELEASVGGLADVKLLQFQVATHRGQYSRAEQLLTELKAGQCEPIEAAIAEIDLLVARGKIDEAISELYSLREKFAQNVFLIEYLASLSAKHRGITECENILKDAMQDIKAPVAKRDLGILSAAFYRQWKQNEKACQLLMLLAEELPCDIAVKRELLKNEYVIKDVNQAQQLIDNIRIIEGDQGWQWRYEQANIWFVGENFKSNYPQIISLLKKNLSANPADKTSRILLAATYEKAGELQLAVTTYREALNRTPEDLQIIVSAVAAMYRAKEYKQANEILDRVTRQKVFDLLSEAGIDDSKIFLAEANLLKDDQSWDILSTRIDDWIRQNPNDTNVPVILAGDLIATKNEAALDTAENLLRTMLHFNPHCIEAMNSLAVLLQVKGRHSEAADVYKQILEIKPEALVAINNLAWIMCEEQGEYHQALELTQKGLRKAPEYVDLIDTRGVVYYRMAEHDKAVEDFTTCLELYPGDSLSLALSHFHLARALLALGQDDKAWDNLHKAMQLNDKIGGLSSTVVTETQLLFGELFKKAIMCATTNNKNTQKDNKLFEQRPPGILLDGTHWLHLKERYQMTARELQVAILVCRGFNNSEIANALKIKQGTVKTHLRNLYRRVRVKSKILLLLRFIEDVDRFYGPSKRGTPAIPISEIPHKLGLPSKIPLKK